ncbi:Valine--pyruvate aminotransferase [Oleoguttula sp. CCFEE 5521]
MAAHKQPINLLRGWPAPSLLPTSLVLTATQAALSSPSIARDALLYGPDPGYEPARVAIAAWLTAFYIPDTPTPAERLCITGGASQNLGNVLSVYTDPEITRKIWIVAPAYFLAFRIFEDAGFGGRMKGVPERGDGVDLEMLEREMEKCEGEWQKKELEGGEHRTFKSRRSWGKVYKHVIYCVPSFANPSSRTMSLECRRGLVKLARKFDALVVADDVYDFLQWPADTEESAQDGVMKTAHLPRLVDVDRSLDHGAEREGADGFGNTCSNGSFSKIAGPGIRCGWVEGTKNFAFGISQAGTTRSGGAPSQLTSTYVTYLVETGQLQEHIQKVLCPAYAARYASMMRAISTHLSPLGFTLPQSDRDVVGGYFIWLGLPAGLMAVDLARVCKTEEDVIVAAGEMFEVPGDQEMTFPAHIRLCFAWENEELLSEGVERIGKVTARLLKEMQNWNGEYVMVEGREAVDMDAFK